jgi:hypothetical protein
VSEALTRLARVVRAEGRLPAGVVVTSGDGALARHGALAASGPRARGREAYYELLVEAIREGYLLHYGDPRVVITADADLALLAGDRLYALGLDRLARLGDLDAVGVLADVISLSARAHAAADAQLAEAVWEAGAAAVGWGPGEPWARAAEGARTGRPGAAEDLRDAAHTLRRSRPGA